MILVLENEKESERNHFSYEQKEENDERVSQKIVLLQILYDRLVTCLNEVEDQPVWVW